MPPQKRQAKDATSTASVSHLPQSRGLGAALRSEMQRRGLSQAAAAKELDVSVQALRKWTQLRPDDGSTGPRAQHHPKLVNFLRLGSVEELTSLITGAQDYAPREKLPDLLAANPPTAEQLDSIVDKLVGRPMTDRETKLAEWILRVRGLPPISDMD